MASQADGEISTANVSRMGNGTVDQITGEASNVNKHSDACMWPDIREKPARAR